MSEESGREGRDRLALAYEGMLRYLHDGVKRLEQEAIPALGERLGQARERMVELGELTREEAEKVSLYVERDMHDAAHFLVETGEGISNWLRTDITLIESRLLEMFAQVADQTSLQLKEWSDRARNSPRRSGQVSGPGVLVCTQCGEELHFHKAGRIPPCPKCRGSEFMRSSAPRAEGMG